MKSLKERQAEREQRAKENGTEAPKLIYGEGQPIANGGFGLGSNADGLNQNDSDEPNPPGSGENPNQFGKSIIDEARSFAGLGSSTATNQTGSTSGSTSNTSGTSDGGNGGGSGSGSGENGGKTIDEMTVAELDDYIVERGGTPTGNKEAKVTQAKALPATKPPSGWQA
jgi:hypothetical protein